MVIAGFLLCLLGFAVIGGAAARVAVPTADDYVLAGRRESPWLLGLSAVATNCSGYMFIGQVGLTYAIGVSSAWLAVGWIVGDAIVWATCYSRLRSLSEREDVRTVPSLFRVGDDRRLVRVIAVVVLVLLTTYAAAQLRASGKAMHVMLDVETWVGAVLAALTALYYSRSGGFRASVWTDAAQSVLMIGAIGGILFTGLRDLAPRGGLVAVLGAQDPSLLDAFAGGGRLGFAPWALGWLGAGLGVLGQPTIVVRTMALPRVEDTKRAALAYFGWFIPFYAATLTLGLVARALLPSLADPELAMPTLATTLLPPFAVGVMLAGVFAATLSTADSQLLICSSAIVDDLGRDHRDDSRLHARATALVCATALLLALVAPTSVFVLVLFAWSGLGATLGPMLALRAYGRVIPSDVGIAMCVVGLGTVVACRLTGFGEAIYELVPGAAAAFLVYGVLTRTKLVT